MPSSYPAGSRDQQPVPALVAALAANPDSYKPSGRIIYARADAEADQGIALIARALVEHRVASPSTIAVESADGDYVLHDDPTTSYGHQIFWSYRRRSIVVLDRARLYRDPAFPAKTERGARILAALIGDDTSREGRLGWSVKVIADLVSESRLDLVRRCHTRSRSSLQDAAVDEVLDYALVDSVKGTSDLNYVRKLIEIRHAGMASCRDASEGEWLEASCCRMFAQFTSNAMVCR